MSVGVGNPLPQGRALVAGMGRWAVAVAGGAGGGTDGRRGAGALRPGTRYQEPGTSLPMSSARCGKTGRGDTPRGGGGRFGQTRGGSQRLPLCIKIIFKLQKKGHDKPNRPRGHSQTKSGKTGKGQPGRGNGSGKRVTTWEGEGSTYCLRTLGCVIIIFDGFCDVSALLLVSECGFQ